MTDYLAKPVEVDVLLAAIARVAGAVSAPVPPAPGAPQAGGAGGGEASPFDPAALERRFPGRTEFWQELVDAFATHYPVGVLRDMREQAARGELESVGKVAHKLKGVLGTICAEQAGGLAGKVLAACLAGDSAAVLACLEPLEREVERIAAFASPPTA
jgi:HPt (histidine-containing phosphotransfer) domain-containing protein